MKRTITVLVEKKPDTPLGVANGKTIYHTIETGPPRGNWSRWIFRGCPLGRGYSEEDSIDDFILRANADGIEPSLRRSEIKVVERMDYTQGR